ncbi:MAG: WYL domain-containing protein [Bacteroidota bacterium]
MANTTQNRLYQIFQLIRLLNTPPRRTAKQLMRQLDIGKNKFYESIKTLEAIGYPVEVDVKHRYFLAFQFQKRANEGILESDELLFLQEQLQQVPSNSPNAQFAQSILHKFDRNLTMIPLADMLPLLHRNRILQLLRDSIEQRFCVLLQNYRSMSSDKAGNRRIEPLDITPDKRYLIAWDLDKDRQSQFKLARIEDIEILDDKLPPTPHDFTPMDLFGLTGDAWLPVKIKLSKYARHLLVEEFPDSRQYVRVQRGEVYFDGMVRSWKGIGRFVLGLPGEMEVLAPTAFKNYLQERVDKFNI